MDEVSSLLLCLSTAINATTLKQLEVICKSMLCMTGRVTMLGISRWSGPGGSYRTIQRFFKTMIPWGELNWLIAKKQIKNMSAILIAGDATIITKSGKETHGVGRFFSSIYSTVIRGLSFQTMSLIDPETRTSFPILAEQIMPKTKEAPSEKNKTKRGRGRPKGSKNKNKEEVVLNAEMKQVESMLKTLKAILLSLVTPVYFLYDGAFGNNAAIQMVKGSGFNLISKLKRTSALYFPWEGESSGRGAPRKYGAKVDYENLPNTHLRHEETEGEITTRYYQLTVLSRCEPWRAEGGGE